MNVVTYARAACPFCRHEQSIPLTLPSRVMPSSWCIAHTCERCGVVAPFTVASGGAIAGHEDSAQPRNQQARRGEPERKRRDPN